MKISLRASRSAAFFLLNASLICCAWSASAAPETPVHWIAYHSDELGFDTKVPADWTVRNNAGKAVGFTSPDDAAGAHAAIGVLKNTSKKLSIEEAAEKEYQREGRPATWARTPARFGGARAIKIIGGSSKAPGMKMIQYYVETADGYYLIQCIAPEEEWAQYAGIFSTMISRFTFVP